MKDYFADIIPEGVAGVTRCNIISNPSNTKAYRVVSSVTPDSNVRGDECNTPANNIQTVLHPITPIPDNSVTTEARKAAIETPVTPGTPDNYYTTFFMRSATNSECNACISKLDAEAIAYKYTLSEWIYNNPPVGYEITHCAYCCAEIDFSAGGYQAWGGVYCCYHSHDNECLKPYLQSRIKEAKGQLHKIGVITDA